MFYQTLNFDKDHIYTSTAENTSMATLNGNAGTRKKVYEKHILNRLKIN